MIIVLCEGQTEERFIKEIISTEAQINRYFSAKGNHKGLPLHGIA